MKEEQKKHGRSIEEWRKHGRSTEEYRGSILEKMMQWKYERQKTHGRNIEEEWKECVGRKEHARKKNIRSREKHRMKTKEAQNKHTGNMEEIEEERRRREEE